MILVGAIGGMLSLACYWIANPSRSTLWSRIFYAILLMHIAASFVYWQYSMAFAADSRMYYNQAPGIYVGEIRPGTSFVIAFVSYARSIFGGTYLDYFFLFQAFGVAGIALCMRSAQEILQDLNQNPDWKIFAVFFLPGLHFWTCAIGKDAPLFFAVALSVWAAIKIDRRYPAFALALAVMAPVRPHIAAIATIALLVTLLFDARIRLILKLPMLVTTIVAAVWVIASAQESLRIAELNPDTIGDFIASKQEYGMRSADGAALTSLPLPLKILSLLFRPLFFDAGGAFGLIVSFENLALLTIMTTIVIRWRDVAQLFKAVSYMRYCLIFSTTLIILLSLVTYNVGLGLRQKYMAMPAILLMFITLLAYRRARQEETMAMAAPLEVEPHRLAPPTR